VAKSRGDRQGNPALSAVIEVFGMRLTIPPVTAPTRQTVAGLPFLMSLGPTMGRLQQMGSLMMRGNRAASDTFPDENFVRPGSI
jgi:amidase/6-aminohexanoate-cyclic-dimer hydrolase